jgi:hypothetical protein
MGLEDWVQAVSRLPQLPKVAAPEATVADALTPLTLTRVQLGMSSRYERAQKSTI